MANPIAKRLPYDTNPPSAASTRQPILGRSVFDRKRIAVALAQGLIDGLPPLDDPTDDLLIATVVSLGMPRWSAEQMRYHPGLRLQYYLLWLDVSEAARGNVEARGRVDGCREAWSEMRKIELVTDRPDMSIGMWER